MNKKENRGGPGRGQGRKPLPPGQKKQCKSITLTPRAWQLIDSHALAFDRSRSEQVQALVDRILESK